MAEMLSDFGHIIGLNGSSQVAVMPTYSTVAAGTIVQYVGSTDANYTNGYFYKATASGWEMVDVQGEDANKADKVSSPTAGNLAGLNASGNLTDAGVSSDMTETSVTAGNPVTFTTKSAQLAKNTTITLNPIQAGSGDPSPSNVRAISGYDKIEVLSCGKNLVESIETGYYDYDTGATGSSNNYCRTSKFNIVGGKKYSLQVGVWGSPVNTIFYWKDDTYLGYDDILITSGVFTYTFTTREDANMCAISCGGSNYPITPERWGDVMVEYGEIATSFEPYNKSTDLSLQLGQTIYGGTLDVEKGILTVDKKCIDLGSLDYTYDSVYTRFRSNVPVQDIGGTATYFGQYDDVICSIYKSTDDASNNSIFVFYAPDHGLHQRIFAYDSRYTDATAFKTAITGQKLCYELAEPYTIQLTPHQIQLLSGYNYVSTNGTSLQLTYRNGEVASLADVENVGKTLNLLGDVVATNESLKWKLLDSTVFPITDPSTGQDTYLKNITIPAVNNIEFHIAAGMKNSSQMFGGDEFIILGLNHPIYHPVYRYDGVLLYMLYVHRERSSNLIIKIESNPAMQTNAPFVEVRYRLN